MTKGMTPIIYGKRKNITHRIKTTSDAFGFSLPLRPFLPVAFLCRCEIFFGPFSSPSWMVWLLTAYWGK